MRRTYGAPATFSLFSRSTVALGLRLGVVDAGERDPRAGLQAAVVVRAQDPGLDAGGRGLAGPGLGFGAVGGVGVHHGGVALAVGPGDECGRRLGLLGRCGLLLGAPASSSRLLSRRLLGRGSLVRTSSRRRRPRPARCLRPPERRSARQRRLRSGRSGASGTSHRRHGGGAEETTAAGRAAALRLGCGAFVGSGSAAAESTSVSPGAPSSAARRRRASSNWLKSPRRAPRPGRALPPNRRRPRWIPRPTATTGVRRS